MEKLKQENIKLTPDFNWAERIDLLKAEAKKRKPGDYNEAAEYYHDLRDDSMNRAGNWFTCACGSIDTWIERDPDTGVPKDGKLQFYGSAFQDHIDFAEYDNALETLNKIEQRALELSGK